MKYNIYNLSEHKVQLKADIDRGYILCFVGGVIERYCNVSTCFFTNSTLRGGLINYRREV